jgi:hypothetical protein
MSRQSETQLVSRFRVNPIEVTFLSVISLVFLNSVYNLIYEHHGIQVMTQSAMATHPKTEGRTIASTTTTKSFFNFSLDCAASTQEITSASYIRVSGLICGYNPEEADETKPKIQVSNRTNRNAATVFPDLSLGKFSTDYFTLENGENHIQVEIKLNEDKVITKEIIITRSNT